MSKVKNLEDVIKDYIREGRSESAILELVSLPENNKNNLNLLDLKKIVSQIVSDYPNYELIQQITRSYIVYPEDTDETLLYDLETRETKPIRKDILSQINQKVIDVKQKSVQVERVYEPMKRQKLFKDKSGSWKYNIYQPPFWLEDYHNQRVDTVPARPDLPELYRQFLHHFVDGKDECIRYIINWMAMSLQERNIPYLIAIGRQGAGKGTLAEILQALHGTKNYATANKSIVKKEFNKEYHNKRLVYINEIEVGDKNEANRLKTFADETISIEGKGKDGVTIRNWASTFISSNSSTSLKFEGEDRRFSIMDITKKDLKTVVDLATIKSYTAPENIEQLGRFLFNFKIDKPFVLKNFGGETAEVLRDLSLADWETFIVDEFAQDKAGDEVTIKELSDKVSEATDYKYITRPKLVDLANKLPGYFEIKKIKDKTDPKGNRRKWAVVFKKLEDQPKDRHIKEEKL